MSFVETLPDFSEIILREKEEAEKEALLEQETEEEWVMMKFEEVIERSDLDKKRMLELFIEALDLPYGNEILKAISEIEFKYYGRLHKQQDIEELIKEFWR